MRISWSFHARDQRADILRKIAQEQTRDCASRWNARFRDTVNRLAEFPDTGLRIPETCFASQPDHPEQLRMIACPPYRIVYEHLDDQIHVLAIMHQRMMVWTSDTRWN